MLTDTSLSTDKSMMLCFAKSGPDKGEQKHLQTVEGQRSNQVAAKSKARNDMPGVPFKTPIYFLPVAGSMCWSPHWTKCLLAYC